MLFYSKERVVRDVGEALRKGNPKLGYQVYECLGEIVASKSISQDTLNELDKKLDSLLNYLGVVYYKERHVISKKPKQVTK